MNKKTFIKASMAVASVAVIALASCGKKTDANAAAAAQQNQPPLQIAVEEVGYSSLNLNQSYPATIKGRVDIDVRPLVSGNITKVCVDEGDRVSKGQVLFEIDKVTFQAAVDQAQAAVNAAKVAVESAQLTANQKQNLFDKNIISEYENQMAKNSLATAKANLKTAEAALEAAKKNLSYTVVTAPTDGVIGSIPFREGSLASPSMAMPLTTVSDNSDVYAYFSLTEKELLDLTGKGAKTVEEAITQMPPVQLRLADGSMYPLDGNVATISGVIGSSTGAATVRALFPNPSGMLRSGSTGEVIIPTNAQNVIVIPQRATQELQGTRFVYVVNDSNMVNMTPIQVAKNNDGQNYIVTWGLQPGQVIAVEGVGLGAKLKNGMVIEPVDAATKAAQAAQAPNAAR